MNHQSSKLLINTGYMIQTDEESGGACAIDPNGLLMTESEAKELFAQLQIFFDYYGSEAIDEANRERLNRASTPVRPPTGTSGRKIRAGWIYVLESPEGLFKIGKTTRQPNIRLQEFAPKLPFETALIHSIQTDDTQSLEESLHQQFGDKRVRGEWFRLDEQDLEYLRGL